MLARCAQCRHVFRTERYGEHRCPSCGAQLMLWAPASAQPASAAAQPTSSEAGAAPEIAPSPSPEAGAGPSSAEGSFPGTAPASEASTLPTGPAPDISVVPGGPVESQPEVAVGTVPVGLSVPPPSAPAEVSPQVEGEPTPWERREGGVFRALLDTLRGALFEPFRFFERMRTADARGTLSYFWLLWAFFVVAYTLWSVLFSAMPINQSLPPGFPKDEQFARLLEMQASPLFNALFAASLVVAAPFVLYLSAGVIHLFAMLFGATGRGFNATLRSVAYGAAPLILAVVPGCGYLGALVWWVVLVILGLWKTQRTSGLAATGSVLAPTLVFCVGFCGCSVLGFAMAASQMVPPP